MTTLPESTWCNLPVETVSGTHLGKLRSVELDPESHRVAFYHVRPKRIVPSGPDLLVAPNQVVSFTDSTMVVEDLVARDAEAARQRPKLAPTAPALSSEG